MPIEIKNLTHTYMAGSPFQATAIRDVLLSVRDGEFIGLIGHTGSGKSTLIQHMNALLLPTKGSVLVYGMDIAEKANHRDIRRKVGLVFQYPEHQLFEETVLKDIAFGPKNIGLSEEEALQRAREAAITAGLSEDLFEKSPFELSGGEKRRVAIAGVLAMEPDTLILDEPAAGLDPSGRGAMLALLKELHEKGNLTLIMVSHSMNDVAEMCSRIIVMDRGRIAMDGTTDEVFRHARELSDMGLGVPDTALLGEKLRKMGFDLPDNLWRLNDMAEQIAAVLAKKGGRGE
ncbi:MAG: energy-coupling factor transporter ATPase [Christensenellales bacterium]|jgi:energy-coupling factor transporter ATPase